jgi:hypothetical protein
MRPGLDGIIADQHGIIARWQAIGCGVTPREFDRLTRPGAPWVKVRYGVYTTREVWNSLDRTGRQLLRDRAALLVCEDDAVLSHTSAARLLGLPLYGSTDDLSHVIRTDPSQSHRVQAGLQHHLGYLDAGQIVNVDGLAVTCAERTVLDLALTYGFHTGIVAADAALHADADRERLTSLRTAMTSVPRHPEVRSVIDAADGRAETPIETLGRLTVINMNITDLELQYVIRFSGGGHAVGDIYSRSLNHLFECDGRLKYQDQVDAGGELITADQVVWLEKKREDKVRGEGIGFSRLLWPDVQPENFERTARRLWREIEQQSGFRSDRLPPGA